MITAITQKSKTEKIFQKMALFWVKIYKTLHERNSSKLSDCMTRLFKANHIKISIDWEKIFRPYGETPVTKYTPAISILPFFHSDCYLTINTS